METCTELSGGGTEEKEESSSVICAICLSEQCQDEHIQTLPCSHQYHIGCINELKKYGIVQVCPLCRAPLPFEETTFEGAIRRWLPLAKKYGVTNSWEPLDGDEKKLTDQVRTVCERVATLQDESSAEPEEIETSAEAAAFLSETYTMGLGVPRDPAMGLTWCRKAAERGRAKSQHNLGVFYREGLGGVEQSMEEALKWFHKGAQGGNVSSNICIGYAYENGSGVQKDGKRALEYYRKAAHDHPIAMNNLGLAYKNGTCGVERNFEEGLRWIKRAANMGNVSAQMTLGNMHASGEIGRGGAPAPSLDDYMYTALEGGANPFKRDLPQALKWYRKAAAQGDAAAATAVTRIVRMEQIRAM